MIDSDVNTMDLFDSSGSDPGLDPSSIASPVPWYKRLWATVLRRAAVDWILYKDHTDHKLRKWGLNAGKWLFDDSTYGYLGTFHSVCLSLNLEPDVVKSMIKSLTPDQARKLRGMEFGDEW